MEDALPVRFCLALASATGRPEDIDADSMTMTSTSATVQALHWLQRTIAG